MWIKNKIMFGRIKKLEEAVEKLERKLKVKDSQIKQLTLDTYTEFDIGDTVWYKYHDFKGKIKIEKAIVIDKKSEVWESYHSDGSFGGGAYVSYDIFLTNLYKSTGLYASSLFKTKKEAIDDTFIN
jgi:hypothetical protein